jgi:hypothetical protein
MRSIASVSPFKNLLRIAAQPAQSLANEQARHLLLDGQSLPLKGFTTLADCGAHPKGGARRRTSQNRQENNDA